MIDPANLFNILAISGAAKRRQAALRISTLV